MPISKEEFNRRLALSYQNLRKNLIRNTVILSLEMQRHAKENARRDPKVVTGRLRNSIQSFSENNSGAISFGITAGGSTFGSDKMNLKRRYDYKTGTFYTAKTDAPRAVWYAVDLEFGKGRLYPRLFMGRAVKHVQRTLVPKLLGSAWTMAATGRN